MLGALSVGKKAVSFGYKRYGVPGAVASGGAVLIGYVVVRRALQAATEADEGSIGAAIDAESLEAAIDQNGLQAVTNVGTIDEAIDREQLRSNVDIGTVQSDVESSIEETDEFDGEYEQGPGAA
ncbi:hypothetical protein [Natronorubrum texcoconense]|uniref:Uncharacterized protein n=1 Tax=Natronorubrum texcoconense TaxID=1095776 RepID=A0A1G9A011_9EURY|nr:hypothetical protein [Natronorubrum texcoconense]SDK20712.1 hypothetical protein SAMN04515672_2526 [Natronorubrum texcoconense]